LNGSQHVTCAAVARNGSIIAASTSQGTKLFLIEGPEGRTAAVAGGRGQQQQEEEEEEEGGDGWGPSSSGRAAVGGSGQWGVQRVKLQGSAKAPALCLEFSIDGSLLFAVDGKGVVRAIDVTTGEAVAQVKVPGLHGSVGGSSSNMGQRQDSIKQKAGQDDDHQSEEERDGDEEEDGVAAAGPSAAAGGGSGGLRPYLPLATGLAASPDGKWLAVATAAGKVQLLQLQPQQQQEQELQPVGELLLLSESAQVTAVAFSPDSSLVAVATAGGSTSSSSLLATYSVDTRTPTQWSLDHADQLGEMLIRLPGSIAGISFNPLLGVSGGGVWEMWSR
jgi:WD40 repeat protein